MLDLFWLIIFLNILFKLNLSNGNFYVLVIFFVVKFLFVLGNFSSNIFFGVLIL